MTFDVTLPTGNTQHPTINIQQTTTNTTENTMTKILVIEDEDAVRENLLELLETEDFEIISATNGRKGVDLAFSEVPDLILCDMMMPELDGYGVLTALHQDQIMSTIPFIFLTAKSSKLDFRQGMDLGADDYLTKPFTRAELLSAIFSRLEKQAKLKKYLAKKPETKTFLPGIQIIEAKLRRALQQGNLEEFQVNYQPVVDTNSGKIIAAESLLRWQSPELGLVSPAELIPLAESTGLIIPIGEWVLERICQQTKAWHDLGFSRLKIAVNLSEQEFYQPDLSQKIVDFLAANDLIAHCLELEVTETMIMQNVNSAIATMKQLQSLGVRITIDDFGIGNSTLIYLKQLPINSLKLDRYFIKNVDNDPEKSAITSALIQMGQNLNLQVIAKGVETEAELDFLRQHKCDAIQGFLFSHPIPTTELEQLLLGSKSLDV
jgi:EAL domain-containing protein (putative c-di-GMP-specific phosphodiesterase class I)/ActR/RegA family two-component response regulator